MVGHDEDVGLVVHAVVLHVIHHVEDDVENAVDLILLRRLRFAVAAVRVQVVRLVGAAHMVEAEVLAGEVVGEAVVLQVALIELGVVDHILVLLLVLVKVRRVHPEAPLEEVGDVFV